MRLLLKAFDFYLLAFFAAIVSSTLLSNRIQSNSTQNRDECPNLHTRTEGFNLVCCNSATPPFEHYSPIGLCESDECECSLQIGELSCGKESCNPSIFPNLQLPYFVTIDKWNSEAEGFLNALCSLNVVSITFFDVGTKALNLGGCFRRLETVEFSFHSRKFVKIVEFLRDAKRLKYLRLLNVDFDFADKIFPSLLTLETLHIENSSLTQLPREIIKNEKLTRITIKGTELRSVSAISQLHSLQSAHLSSNLIDDLQNVVFVSAQLKDLDLNWNQLTAFSTHSFSRCVDLRVLDLSQNPLTSIPPKAFANNRRLKYLKLSYTRISVLTATSLTGMPLLRSLSLDHTPIHSIHPLAFVSLKSLKSLDLESANLSKIPVAVTQLCHLTHLNLGYNLLHSSSSFPPEVLVQLSSLSDLRLDGNPLKEFPASVLLLSTANVRLMRQIVHTLTALPVWTSDRCTPYYFMMHFKNSSSSLRNLVSAWSEERMNVEGLGYCRERYEWIRDNDDLYAELEKNSGCSVSRRLRGTSSTLSSTQSPSDCPSIQSIPSIPSLPSLPSLPSIQSSISSTCGSENEHLINLLIASLSINILLFISILFILCLCCSKSKRKGYVAY